MRALTDPAPPATRAQEVARIGLGAFMAFAGTSHLTFARKDFQAQVPDWFPIDKDAVVLGSGVVEALEKIADQVERHPPIGHFAHPPKVLAVSDSLLSAAETAVECDLSQLPAYDGDRYVGMFTTGLMRG